MNSNEAISYLLQFLPWPLTNMCVIGGEFHLIFDGYEKVVVLPKVDRYKATDLDKLIRGLRK